MFDATKITKTMETKAKTEKSLFEIVNDMMDAVDRVKALQEKGKRDLFEQCYDVVRMDLMTKGIKIN